MPVVVTEVVGVAVCGLVMVVVWEEVMVEAAVVVGVVRTQLTKGPLPNDLMTLLRVPAVASQLLGTLKSPPIVHVTAGAESARRHSRMTAASTDVALGHGMVSLVSTKQGLANLIGTGHSPV